MKKQIDLPGSLILDIGEGKPIIGIVGLVHGDEICGRKVLDELSTSDIKPKGTLRLIYANLEGEKKGVRGVEDNLNRTFTHKRNGNYEERVANNLSPYLAECDYVLDIHSTSYPTEPFTVSTIDSPEFDRLVSYAGLKKYVIMVDKMANGESLIDEVNRNGGQGISFESGTHQDESSVNVARSVVYNFLKNLGFIEGEAERIIPEKFYGKNIISVPSKTFIAYDTIKNFLKLAAGTSYGKDDEREYSLDYDCYPFLFSDKLIDGLVFLVGQKE